MQKILANEEGAFWMHSPTHTHTKPSRHGTRPKTPNYQANAHVSPITHWQRGANFRHPPRTQKCVCVCVHRCDNHYTRDLHLWVAPRASKGVKVTQTHTWNGGARHACAALSWICTSSGFSGIPYILWWKGVRTHDLNCWPRILSDKLTTNLPD